jgi:hypothetical protein
MQISLLSKRFSTAMAARAAKRSLLLVGIFVALASCRPTDTPSPLDTPMASQALLPKSSSPPVANTQRATRTAPPTHHPTLTFAPTIQTDLDSYFAQNPGDRHQNPPQWMQEPPGDRQIILEGNLSSMTLSLLNNQGDLLAQFTPSDSDWGSPTGVLWSSSKERAVVLFLGSAGEWTNFILIDRDGHRLSDVLGGYYFPVWSPTQELIAFEGLQAGENRLCIMDGAGTLLVASPPISPRLCLVCGDLPQWSPTGDCAALTVYIGEAAVPWDDLLVTACASGTASLVKLREYDLRHVSARWLDTTHLVLRGSRWLQSDVTRYMLFDLRTGALQEVTNSIDLTPAPAP